MSNRKAATVEHFNVGGGDEMEGVMQSIEKMLQGLHFFNEIVGKLVSYLIWIGALILAFEVVARYAFNSPTIWAHGYTQRVFGAYFILIGAFTLIRGYHVRVDLLMSKSPSLRNNLLDLVNYTFLVVWAFVLTSEGWILFYDAWAYGELDNSALKQVMWPAKFSLFFGGLIILLQGSAELISCILRLINPNYNSYKHEQRGGE